MGDEPEGKPECLGPGGAAEIVQQGLKVIEGRWKLAIVFRLFAGPALRFSELERDIAGVSQKMLAQHLRALERDGLVHRTVYPEVPPRVTYRLTASGEALRPALLALRIWGGRHLAPHRVEPAPRETAPGPAASRPD